MDFAVSEIMQTVIIVTGVVGLLFYRYERAAGICGNAGEMCKISVAGRFMKIFEGKPVK